jgi:hypothetical protein
MANHEAIITPVLENIFSGKVCHDGEDQCDYDLTEQADFARKYYLVEQTN